MPYRTEKHFIPRENPPIAEQIVNLCTHSKKRMVLTALAGWLISTTVSFAVFETLVGYIADRDTRIFINATILGGLFGVSIMVLLVVMRDRRAHMRHEIRQIAELNHHVRNALQAIYYSTYAAKDAQLIEVVNEAVERIDTALKGVLPIVGERGMDGIVRSILELISFGIYRERGQRKVLNVNPTTMGDSNGKEPSS